MYDVLSDNKEISEHFQSQGNKDNFEFLNKLARTELKSISDFESLLKSKKIEKMSLNSNIIISLILEKFEDSNNQKLSQEQQVVSISRLDFVELAGSEYGLPSERSDRENNINNYNIKIDTQVYKSVNESFNALYNHIISSALRQNSKANNVLTQALKSTINMNSNITILTCVIPIDSDDSNRALKVLYIIDKYSLLQ